MIAGLIGYCRIIQNVSVDNPDNSKRVAVQHSRFSSNPLGPRLPSAHSTYGDLCGHRIFLCHGARVVSKQASPPLLTSRIFCYVHHLIYLLFILWVCTQTVICNLTDKEEIEKVVDLRVCLNKVH